MRGWFGGILAGLAVFAATGCELFAERSCNAIGPSCALAVSLDHEGWEPGLYTFRAIAGGAEESCTVELPWDRERMPGCTSPEVGFGRFPNFQEVEDDSYPAAFYHHGTPPRVEVVVERDGVELGRERFRPRYAITEPHGEGCGDCANATVTMSF